MQAGAGRLFAIAAMLVPVTGCPDRTIAEVPVDQDKIEQLDIPAVPKGFDILFVIDDSGSMVDEQASLRANFPKMIEVLEQLEGGLPDVHIGVVTPNMGTSATDGSSAAPAGTCSGQGEGGALRALDREETALDGVLKSRIAAAFDDKRASVPAETVFERLRKRHARNVKARKE